ncbi:hypothetical protein AK812_SmicGene1438 [Symbiodinium microadriaticum]|uniref:Uncharacterized protein n=1 Tax=Symbiodinium microadriaticum TaxID=2951 RepID=A0A1Q9F475_SYMMI|nr:hypothetical protein AK812_SmicGene1438 [Symbiodinium microadriaticum]
MRPLKLQEAGEQYGGVAKNHQPDHQQASLSSMLSKNAGVTHEVETVVPDEELEDRELIRPAPPFQFSGKLAS